jgi:hypothetical protein
MAKVLKALNAFSKAKTLPQLMVPPQKTTTRILRNSLSTTLAVIQLKAIPTILPLKLPHDEVQELLLEV